MVHGKKRQGFLPEHIGKKRQMENRETNKVKGKSKKSNIRIMGVLQRER